MGYIPLKIKKKVLSLKEEGMGHAEIAKTLGITQKTVGEIINRFWIKKEEKAAEKEKPLPEPSAAIISPDLKQPAIEPVVPNISVRMEKVRGNMNPTKLDSATAGVKPIRDYVKIDPTTYKVADILVERGIARDMNEAVDLGLKMLYVKAGLDEEKQGESMREPFSRSNDKPAGDMSDLVKTMKDQLTLKMLKNMLLEEPSKFDMGKLIEAQMVKALEGKSGLDLKELAYLQALNKGGDSNPQLQAAIQNMQNQINQLQLQLSSKQSQGLDPNMILLLTQSNKNLPEILGVIQQLDLSKKEREHQFETELQKLRDQSLQTTQKFYEDKALQTQELVKELKQRLEAIGESRGIDKTITEQLAGEVAAVVLEKAKKGLSEARGETTTTDAAVEVAKTAMPLVQELIKAGRQQGDLRQQQYLQQLAQQQAMAQEQSSPTELQPAATIEQAREFEEEQPTFSEFIPGESLTEKKKKSKPY